MKAKVGNKIWELLRGKPKDFGGSNSNFAHCDHPNTKSKQIIIDPNIKDQLELEIFIHELLHAADWSKSEEWVNNIAADIANILWKEGYRKV